MTTVDALVAPARSTPLQQIIAIARRDAIVELSYPMAIVTRMGAIASTIATFFFVARIVDPGMLERYDGRYFEFVLVGLLLGQISSMGLASLSETIRSEQSSGTLEVLLATPTALPTLFAGAMIVPLGFVALEVVLVFGAAVVFLDAHFQLAGVATALLAVPPTLGIFAAVGACSAGFIVLSKRGDPFTPLVGQVTNFLSGMLFPVTVLPVVLEKLAYLLPPYYSLEVLRGGLINGDGIGELAVELAILTGFAVVSLPLSLLFFRAALRKARETGTLGAY